MRRSRWL